MTSAPGVFPPGHPARILTFPLRDRPAVATSRDQKFAAMEAAARRLAPAATADAWYHDAAIADERQREN